jgi:hypothetical protein
MLTQLYHDYGDYQEKVADLSEKLRNNPTAHTPKEAQH